MFLAGSFIVYSCDKIHSLSWSIYVFYAVAAARHLLPNGDLYLMKSMDALSTGAEKINSMLGN